MARKAIVHPTALIAVAGALMAVAPLAQATAAHAASTEYGFTANAFGSSATLKAAGIGTGSGRSAFVILSCTTKPATHTNSTASVSIPVIDTTLGAVTTTVSSTHNTSTGVYADTAKATIADPNALDGLIQGTSITANASASEGGTGGPTATGSVSLSALTIDGKSVASNPKPNTKLTISGIGTVTLNAQKVIKTSGRALMNIDAISIVLAAGNTLGAPVGANIVFGHVLATVSGPVSGLLSGRSFGTSVTGGTAATSGPTFIAYVGCTGNATITNMGSGVTADPLTAGSITDTATGTDTATQLSATTSSTVDSVGVSGVLTLTRISSTASASVTAGVLTTSGGTTVSALKVLGLTVSLPNPIPANYKVPLTGGTLILNRQVMGKSGLLVDALYLTLPTIGTITVGSSSAYA